MSDAATPPQFPLLKSVLSQEGVPLKGIYSIGDAAQIFKVSSRTIQEWVRGGKLRARDLPGHGRFLSEDLELFLQESVDTAKRGGHNV